MSAYLAPAPRRVTVQRIAALCAHYARVLRLAKWRFLCEVVPGLKHKGDDAWAVVDPDPATKTARVSVRDIDATPIPGFDGDPLLEIRVTVAHELFHCVVADAIGPGGALSIPAEERIVETAAQAIVRSEGLDARVMARAVRALPSALRARVAASAGQRARGGQMDPKLIKEALDALIAGDAAKCEEILKGIVVAAATGGAAPAHAEPDGAEVVTVDPMAPGRTEDIAPEDARRAKGAEMDKEQAKEQARARKAILDGEAEVKRALEIIRPAAKTQIAIGLRARLGAALTPAAEAEIAAAPDLATAEALAGFAEKLLGGGNQQRARSGVEHDANPGPTMGAMPTVEALRAEGYTENWLVGYASALKSGPEVASAFLAQGRASARARIAQNGGK